MKIIEPQETARYSMIWMHGLGASHDDMVGLQHELHIEMLPIRHIFLQAPMKSVTINNGMSMPAWYDILGVSFTDREDEKGIKESQSLILQAIQQEVDKGIPPSRIFLTGFSQGGAMALYTGLTYEQPLAGVVVLSGYLPLASSMTSQTMEEKQTMPILIAYGQNDPIVKPEWVTLTIERLKAFGLSRITSQGYPMEHSVCLEEMQFLREWLIRIAE